MSRCWLTPAALCDIGPIRDYMQETFEVGLLEPYVRELRTAIERIAGSGRDCDELRLSYRRYAIGSRLTFYRATVDGVDVIRSLHQRIDPTRHL